MFEDSYTEIKTLELVDIVRLCNFALIHGCVIRNFETEILLHRFKDEIKFRYNKYDNELINNREV